ncbi:MAG TPA: RNA polymerase sigma-54 factor, partial [Thermoanaerobaculia bacterium]
MVFLQPRLSVKLSQRQILTPGLVQMVSVLALNKLELKDMINAEMVENPVLEELEDAIPLIDDVGRQEEERDRQSALAKPEEGTVAEAEKKDPFEEIDFGSFFQEYLDPGYRSQSEREDIEKPSFENFLSKQGNLTDHLRWQLGAISVSPQVHDAAEEIIGNLNEDGYLIASDEELLGIKPAAAPDVDAEAQAKILGEATALGIDAVVPQIDEFAAAADSLEHSTEHLVEEFGEVLPAADAEIVPETPVPALAEPESAAPPSPAQVLPASFSRADLHEALEAVRQFDPPGIACRDLRECLLYQLQFHLAQLQQHRNGDDATEQIIRDAVAVVDQHLHAVTLKQFKEIARAIVRPVEAVQAALDYVRTLDPRPGLQYNKTPARLIEPDVAFVKHGDEWLIIMNDED